MDNIFLKEIAESYSIDRDLPNTQDQAFNYLINTRTHLKTNFPEIYEDIQYSTSKLNQQKLFYSLLDDALLTEDFGMTAGIGVATALGILIYKLFDSFDHALAKIFISMQKMHTEIRENLKSSSLNTFSKENAERYQIVEKLLDDNYSNCSKMCGVKDLKNVNKEDMTNYMRVLFNPGEDYKFLGPRHASEANCLVGCYLDFITSTIAELNLLYNQCLIKTGEISKDSVTTRATAPVGSKCNQLRKDTNSLKKEFDDFLDHLYKNNPRMHSTWVSILNKKIEDVTAGKRITTYGPTQVNSDLQYRQSLGL
jgi:hypothetical protein